MPPNGLFYSGEDVRKIARRTLSRDVLDIRPIHGPYLHALTKFLEKHPAETNILMNLEEQGGTATCMDCWEDVVCGVPVAGEGFFTFGGLGPLEEHVATTAHHVSSADRLRRPETSLQGSTTSPFPAQKEFKMEDIEYSAGIAPFDESPDAPIVKHESRYTPFDEQFYGTSVALSTARKPKKRIVFPDHEVIEISDDDDDIQVLKAPTLPAPLLRANGEEGPSPALQGATYRGLSKVGGRVQQHGSQIQNISAYPSLSTRKKKTVQLDGYVVDLSSDEDDGSFWSGRPTAPYIKQEVSGQVKEEQSPRQQLYPLGRDSYASSTFAGSQLPALPWGRQSAVDPSSQPQFPSSINHLKRHYQDSEDDISYIASQSEHLPDLPYKRLKPEPDWYPHSSWAASSQQSGSSTVKREPIFPGGWPGSNPTLYDPYAGSDLPPQLNPYYDPISRSLPALPPNMNGIDGNNIPIEQLFDRSGFNLNYDDASPIRPIDRGGPDHQEQLKEFFVSAMEAFEDMPTIRDAAKRLGLATPESKIPGMEISLMAHQLIGVDWMVRQESGKMKGGILADDMGLGKTVQTIATMVKNRTDDGDRCGTLIVAPGALLNQWKEEIAAKTVDGLFRVHIHHGKDKLKTVKEVRKYDVVITTYTTLCGDFPKKKKKKKNQVPFVINDDDDDEELERPSGPLALAPWHRVVLDEAQIVRNRATHGSISVANLDATYRWCLSGTPVTNNLADIYALLRFLRYQPWNDWKEFNKRIALIQKKDPKTAGMRAQTLLKKCLLRRTKSSTVEGRPILQLGPKDIEVVEVDFTPSEREIYNAIEAREKMRVSKFIKAGTLMKNYHFILVMLLRLRQACNHPQLVAAGKAEIGEGDVVEDDEDGPVRDNLAGDDPATVVKRAKRDVGAQFVSNMRAKFRKQALVRISDAGEDEEEEDCPICFDRFNIATCCVTSCGHQFCSECINDVLKSPLRQEDAVNQDNNPDSRPCPVCRQPIDKKRIFKANAFAPTADELEELQRYVQPSSGAMEIQDDDDIFAVKGKGKEKANAKVDENLELNLDLDLDLDDELEPSVKMIHMANLIKEWHQEHPEEKIIIYSQWTSMIDLVVKLFDKDHITSLRYDGRMTRTVRDETIARFKKPNGPKILIISLKCGGVGLNLTEANRVICLDLAWNNATEMQAIDRVHRLGQMKPVYVKRLVVRDTIEQRIMALQVAKQGLANAALGEGGVPKVSRMTENDIKMLFDL